MNHAIDQLPPSQQAALRDAAAHGGAFQFIGREGYRVGTSEAAHPLRTVRAMLRAGLVQETDDSSQMVLTDEGRSIAEGRA